MQPQCTPLSDADAEEIDTFFIYGLELLPIDHDKQSEEFVILAIHMLLEAVRLGEELPKGVSMEDFCTYLGVVYGEQICIRYGWEWMQIRMHNYEGAGVVSPSGKTVVFPIPSMYRWTKTENTNRSLVLYEEIGNRTEEGWHVLH